MIVLGTTRRVAMVGALASGMLMWGTASTRAAVECSDYSAQSAADGIRTAFAGNNVLPLVNGTDAEGPSAAALATSNSSSAVAGAPYPGDAALSALSLVGGQAGNAFDSRTYPLSVESQYPTHDDAAASDPGLALAAHSESSLSRASTAGGGASAPGTGSAAGATTTKATASCSGDAGLDALADTDNEAMSFSAGVLRIGRVHSRAEAAISTTGQPRITSRLDVGQFTVAGTTIELTGGSIAAAGQSVPLPAPDQAALKSAGISVQFVAAVSDPDGKGVTAPGLRVTMVQNLNNAGVGTSPSTVTYTFGRAYARVDGTFSQSSPAPSPVSPAALPAPSGGTPGVAARGSAPGSSGSVPLNSALTTPSPPLSSVNALPAASLPGRSAARTLRLDEIDWRVLYVAISAGILLLGSGWLLIRLVGERLAWK